jgi:ABC-2 type transport system ATP-binding protein
MEEAEELADRVGIIDHGRMVVEGSPAALVAQLGADVVMLRGTGPVAPLCQALEAEPYVAHVTSHQDSTHDGAETDEPPLVNIHVGVDKGDQRLLSVVSIATAQGFQIQGVTLDRPSLGQVFLAHTGTALRD